MGNCISAQDRAEKAISDAIDRQLEEDSKRLRKECKILLLGAFSLARTLGASLPPPPFPLPASNSVFILGSGESGKSTIVKQMKIIHQNGFTDEELMSYRPTIYRNTLDSAQAIVLAMRKIGLDCVEPSNRVSLTSFAWCRARTSSVPPQANADLIFDYRIDPSPSFEFSPDIARAIHELWKDPIIPQVMDHSSEFYLMDSAV